VPQIWVPLPATLIFLIRYPQVLQGSPFKQKNPRVCGARVCELDGKIFLIFMVAFSIKIISARAGASGTQ